MSDTSEIGEAWQMMREEDRKRRYARVDTASKTYDKANWVEHTTFHWGRYVKGKKLDFWPSKDKWMWEGNVYTGGLEDFLIKNGEKP